MSNNAFFTVAIIALLALILGAIIAWVYYKQQRELIEKSVQKDSLLPTSLSEIKQLNLNETESGRELLAELTKSSIPNDELEKAISDERDFTEIAVWGTPAAGKSSLFMSFSASLYKYYQLSDVAYQLRNTSDYQSINPFWTPEMPPATQQPTNTKYIFSRQFDKRIKGAKVSSHSHHLLLWDDKGKSLMSLVDGSEKQEITSHRIISADGIIVTLDPSSINRSYSRSDYVSLVSNLIKFVQEKNSSPYFAFCLTKMDKYPALIDNDPWDVLQELFGRDFLNLIKTQLPQDRVMVFITSSLGFENHETRLSEIWEPYNVEFPFFWIFQKLEIKRLSKIKIGFWGKNPLDEYIQYPSPKSRRTKRAVDGGDSSH